MFLSLIHVLCKFAFSLIRNFEALKNVKLMKPWFETEQKFNFAAPAIVNSPDCVKFNLCPKVPFTEKKKFMIYDIYISCHEDLTKI